MIFKYGMKASELCENIVFFAILVKGFIKRIEELRIVGVAYYAVVTVCSLDIKILLIEIIAKTINWGDKERVHSKIITRAIFKFFVN